MTATGGASSLLYGVGGGHGGGFGGHHLGGGSDSVAVDEQAAAQAALDAAEEKLQSLCAAHAGTFVGVERRWRSTQGNLADLLAKISSAQEQVKVAARALDPEGVIAGDEAKDAESKASVSSSSSSSSSSLAYLAEQHRLRRRTLLQHSSLLELLELASLMDACVRSSLYEEALSIAAFANTLERRHGGGAGGTGADPGPGPGPSSGSNSVVTRVVQQIRGRQDDLRRHLLDRLKSQVTMPVCLEVVTALRRLNSIDLEGTSSSSSASASLERVHAAMEFTLQVEFLEARDAWLDSSSTTSLPAGGLSMATAASAMASLGPMQPSEQVLDAIERYRTR
jgi:conserved oligomeric Golgi complex subunit 8